ncbi:MAG: ABC transporter permease, partial [Defluviicoccus sp.]|nr:ABC transporter permease [Defluviicoccus sp.]
MADGGADRVLGVRLTPLTRRRLRNFRNNRRAFVSLWVFLALFALTLPAEFLANDKPLLIQYEGGYYFPVFAAYPETDFGGDFETEAEYREPDVQQLIRGKGGWMVWPLIPYSYRTVNYDLRVPAPAPPSGDNWLGTDDQARDVLARAIYGFRISVLFGISLTVLGSIIGVAVGAAQGYFGGWTDLAFQRFIEVWQGLPTLFLLIILASIVTPSFWWL